MIVVSYGIRGSNIRKRKSEAELCNGEFRQGIARQFTFLGTTFADPSRRLRTGSHVRSEESLPAHLDWQSCNHPSHLTVLGNIRTSRSSSRFVTT